MAICVVDPLSSLRMFQSDRDESWRDATKQGEMWRVEERQCEKVTNINVIYCNKCFKVDHWLLH